MSEKNNLKMGRKGGARRVAEKVKTILEKPTSPEVYEIINESIKKDRSERRPQRKIAAPKTDVEI